MKLLYLAYMVTSALGLPVFDAPQLSQPPTVTPWDHAIKAPYSLHKRVVTIAQNSGLAIGNILGKALGSEVVNLMPDTTTISGLINTLTALGKKANQKYAVSLVESGTSSLLKTVDRHHNPPSAKSPIVRLLEAARDDPTGPWAAIGARIGGPIGRAIGKQLETA